MNRLERRRARSKKGGNYRGLAKPTDNGLLSGSKKGRVRY